MTFVVFCRFFFFFNDTATTEIYTLSLHDALPISHCRVSSGACQSAWGTGWAAWRSEEHTSELQSLAYLVCRLLLEKKKKKKSQTYMATMKATTGKQQNHLRSTNEIENINSHTREQ